MPSAGSANRTAPSSTRSPSRRIISLGDENGFLRRLFPFERVPLFASTVLHPAATVWARRLMEPATFRS
jgi:hypothetical protein